MSQHRGGGGRTLGHHTHSHHSALQAGEWNWRVYKMVKTAITYNYYTLQCLDLHHNTQHIIHLKILLYTGPHLSTTTSTKTHTLITNTLYMYIIISIPLSHTQLHRKAPHIVMETLQQYYPPVIPRRTILHLCVCVYVCVCVCVCVCVSWWVELMSCNV